MTTNHEALKSGQTGRRLAVVLALLALLSMLGACSATTPDLESIGLAIETDIQAGTRADFGFPTQANTAVSVASAPAGVTATVVESGGMQLLSVDVHADTPRGAYNLGISVVRDGEQTVLSWPFDVTD